MTGGGVVRHGTDPHELPYMSAPSGDLSWMSEAACRGVDPGMMFPSRGDHAAVAAAVDVCSDCPVVDACLADALSVSAQEGVRGGLPARERRRMRETERRTMPRRDPSTADRIVAALAATPDMSAAEVAATVGTSRTNASEHLRRLRRSGVVAAREARKSTFPGGTYHRFSLAEATVLVGGSAPDG